MDEDCRECQNQKHEQEVKDLTKEAAEKLAAEKEAAKRHLQRLKRPRDSEDEPEELERIMRNA